MPTVEADTLENTANYCIYNEVYTQLPWEREAKWTTDYGRNRSSRENGDQEGTGIRIVEMRHRFEARFSQNMEMCRKSSRLQPNFPA